MNCDRASDEGQIVASVGSRCQLRRILIWVPVILVSVSLIGLLIFSYATR